MAVRAGTAFIAFRGDFKDVNRQVAAYGKTVDRQLNRGTNAWQAATKKQTQTLQQLGRTARFAAGGAALLGGLAVVKTIGVAADFEQQVSRLGAVSNATGKQLAGLKRDAISAGAATKFSALDAAAAQTELAKGGLSVKQIMGGGLKAALGLAAAGELELADAATFTVNAIKLFGLQGKEAAGVADAFATAANNTTADVGDFGLALAQGGSAAKAAGLSFHETVAALEALAEGGVKGSDAGTSLKTSLAQLAAPTAKQAELAKQLGLNFFDAQGNMLPLVDISAMLRDKLGGLTREQRLQAVQTIAGTDGMRTLLTLFDAGPQKIARFEKQLTKQGTAADVAAKKQDNFRGKLENFQGSIETLQIAVGAQALPPLTDFAERLTDVANEIAVIAAKPNLDLSEKLGLAGKSIEKEFGDDFANLDISEHLGEAISAAIPVIADKAAEAAPKVAGAFVKAFVAASPWGRLAIAGFLLHKFGGLAAFRALGAKGGGAFATGFTATAAPAIAGESALAGAGAGAVGGAAAGRAGRARFGDNFRHGAPVSQLGARRGIGSKVGGALAGGLPAVALTVGLVLGPDVVRNFKRGVQEALGNEKTELQITTDKLVNEVGWRKFHAEIKAGKLGVAGLRKEFEGFSRSQLSLGNRKDLLQDAQSVERLGQEFKRLKDLAIPSLNELRTVSDAQFKRIANVWGTSSDKGRRKLQQNFAASLQSIEGFVSRGEVSGRKGMREIARLMSVYSGKGTAATATNFRDLEGQLGRTFKKTGRITEEGMTTIRLIMTNQLEGLGLTRSDIRSAVHEKTPHSKGPTPQGGRRTSDARGGLVQFGKPGAAGRDSIPVDFGAEKIMVGSGEVGAVFNRHQLPVLNARLADMGGLPGFFKRHDRKHNMATGGIVAPPNGFASGGIVALGRELQREGFAVGENPAFGGVHPVHAPHSYHYSGQAIDVNADNFPGGEAPALDKLYARLKHLPGVVELLWRVAGHFDHLHVAMVGGGTLAPGGGAVDVQAPKIPRITVDGDPGLPNLAVQRALDIGRTGAQTILDRLAPKASGDLGEGAFAGISDTGGNRALGRRMAARFGWGTGPEWNALDDIWGRLEGSWDENLANLAGSGAYGIAQALPSSKYPPAGQPSAPPGTKKAMAQIAWGLQYIKGRYGDPIAAHAFRLAKGWYEQGGLVELARGGGVGFGGGARGKLTDPPATHGLRPSVPGGRHPGDQPVTPGDTVTETLRRTIRKVAGTKSRRKRNKALAPLLSQLDRLGIPKTLTKRWKALDGDVQRFDEFATRAGELTTTDDNGKVLSLGKVQGGSEVNWLNVELGALFKERNTILRARGQMLHRRSQVERALKLSQKRLGELTHRNAHTPKGWKGTNPASDSIVTWNKQPAAKRLRRMKEWQAHGGRLPSAREFRKDGTLDPGGQRKLTALRQAVPALKGQVGKLNTGLRGSGGVAEQLQTVQGFAPMKIYKTLPPVGVLGGDIFTVQGRLRDLAATPPTVTDTTSAGDDAALAREQERSSLLQQQVQELNLDKLIGARQFKVLEDYLLPPYGGSFDKGGTVPGPLGAPRTIIAHGGEEVTPPDKSGKLRVVVEDHRVRVYEDDVERAVDRITRKQSNRAQRPLAGRSGGFRR